MMMQTTSDRGSTISTPETLVSNHDAAFDVLHGFSFVLAGSLINNRAGGD